MQIKCCLWDKTRLVQMTAQDQASQNFSMDEGGLECVRAGEGGIQKAPPHC